MYTYVHMYIHVCLHVTCVCVQVGVVEGVVRVQLWLKVNKRMVNINEEVWSAGE